MRQIDAEGTGDGVDVALHAYDLKKLLRVYRAGLVDLLALHLLLTDYRIATDRKNAAFPKDTKMREA